MAGKTIAAMKPSKLDFNQGLVMPTYEIDTVR
jgi:hypothetical protein